MDAALVFVSACVFNVVADRGCVLPAFRDEHANHKSRLQTRQGLTIITTGKPLLLMKSAQTCITDRSPLHQISRSLPRLYLYLRNTWPCRKRSAAAPPPPKPGGEPPKPGGLPKPGGGPLGKPWGVAEAEAEAGGDRGERGPAANGGGEEEGRGGGRDCGIAGAVSCGVGIAAAGGVYCTVVTLSEPTYHSFLAS